MSRSTMGPGNFQPDGGLGAAVLGIAILGAVGIVAVFGLLMFLSAMLTAAGVVTQAIALSTQENGGFLSAWGENAVYGVLTGSSA
jgi:hypothetical protein